MSDRAETKHTQSQHITLCIVFMPLRQAQSRREILEYAFGRLVVRRMSKVYFGCGYFRVTQFHSLQGWPALLCCTHGLAWTDSLTKSDKIQF